ncbi:MAG TPA: hypothetical protein DIV86_06235 [Alphaproteobacteria bacterium]|nr:hypothetical protein [Alphaproteobacteria bacterium]
MPLDENIIKAKCIDYLLSRHTNELDDYVLVNELKFADGKRRADLVEVNGSMNVYEIKSDLDNLEKLHDQIIDYKGTFDTVTIVTTLKHLNNIKKHTPNNVGVILVDENCIKEVRSPVTYKKFDSFFLASFLELETINLLLKELKVSGRSKLTITEKRKYVSKYLPSEELRGLAINSIKKNYKKQFDGFYNNRGALTLPDDISLFWHGNIIAA